MATKPEEGAQLKLKSSQKKRIVPTITLYKDAAASMQEKPIPNYLRPTISSGQNSKHQHSESASKSPIIKKPVEKAASPSSQSKDKARSLKCPLPKPSNSPSWERASPPKTVKTAKAPTVAPVPAPTPTSSKSSISKGTSSASATKRKETKATPQQGEKILAGEERKAESSPRRDNAEKKEEEGHGIEEKLEEIETTLADSSNGEEEGRKVEGANAALKKEEEAKEKGSPTASSKPAAGKRNKVRALMGAFETVMSMQEAEGQQSPQKGGGGSQNGQLTEEKKPETGQESEHEDNCQLGQQNTADGVQNEEQAEEKNNVEVVEQHIEEQVDKSAEADEGLTESMEKGKESIVSAEESSNAVMESAEENNNGNGIGEVIGSDDGKESSPKES